MPRPDVFELLPEPASVQSAELAVRGQNPASRAAYGDAAGRPCHRAFFGLDAPCRGCLAREALRRGTTERWYMVSGAAPGEVGATYLEVTCVPFRGADGADAGFVETLRDVTTTLGVENHLIRTSEALSEEIDARREEARRIAGRAEELQEQVRNLLEARADALQTEKMASIGRLAAGVAHEIHTPLSTIVANQDLLQRRLKRLEELLAAPATEGFDERLRAEMPVLRELLDLHGLAAARIQKIVRSLRLFAHLDRAEQELVDPHEGIDASLALLAHEMKGRIEVVRDYGPIPHILCRPDAMNQVYMNLLQNAVQAIEGKGTIRVATRSDGPDHVRIEFHDTGCGIAPEDQSRIFDPGFTTKPRGIGTGLGLAISYRTVDEHGGRFLVTSRVGQGTCVALRLPVAGHRDLPPEQPPETNAGE